MLGICLAEHMLVMFLFWECTSISSFFLMGDSESPRLGSNPSPAVVRLAALAHHSPQFLLRIKFKALSLGWKSPGGLECEY